MGLKNRKPLAPHRLRPRHFIQDRKAETHNRKTLYDWLCRWYDDPCSTDDLDDLESACKELARDILVQDDRPIR